MSDAHRDEITKLEALYAENPEGRIFTHLAEAYRKAGELERAHEVLAEGIARHPDYSSAHVVLGRVLMDRDRPEEAEAEFRRVLELDPHNMIAIRSLADLARTRGDDGEAIEYYNRLLEVEPSDEEARAIVEEMTTGVPASGEAVPGEDEAPAMESDEVSWGTEPGWESTGEPLAGDETPADEVPADEVPADGTGPEPADLPDELDEAPWSTTASEPAERDLEWVGSGVDLPERDDGIEVESTAEAGEDGEDAREEDTEVRTETIAQVYARQGLYDRAAEVYRELVRTRPEDEHLRDRLAEMEHLAARTGEDEPAAVEGFTPPADPDATDDAPWGGEPGPIESEEEIVEPEPYAVEGLQTTDFDAAEVDAATVAGLEVDETDPETGLRSDTVQAGADEADEADEALPEPGDSPWAAMGAPSDETAAVDGEEGAPEPESEPSVWTDGDWGGDDAGMTPHAWTDEEGEPDTSSPIRSYFDGLLDWEGADAAPRDPAAGDEAASPSADEPAEEGGETEPAPADPAGGSDEDDDLDMFRSWLESLKQ